MDTATSLEDEAQMTSISLLMVSLISIGIFARNFNSGTRLLVLLVAAGMVIYITLSTVTLK